MNPTSHEPTPEFARFLEWQVTTAVRRQDRFPEPHRAGYAKYLGVAAMVIASMLVGAAGVTAAGRRQSNQEKQVLLLQQQAETRLAEMQLALVQQAAEDARRRSAVGMTGQGEAAGAEQDLQNARLRLQRAQLSVEEVERSGRPVQDDLTSPLVDQRDFVTERLQLEQQAAGIAADSAAQKLKTARTRFEVGLAGELEVLEAQALLAQASSEMRAVHDKIALRGLFLAGKATAAGTTRQRLLLTTRSQLEIAESGLALWSKRYALLKARFEIGTADQTDVLKAQLEMLSKQQDIAQLRARVKTLEDGR